MCIYAVIDLLWTCHCIQCVKVKQFGENMTILSRKSTFQSVNRGLLSCFHILSLMTCSTYLICISVYLVSLSVRLLTVFNHFNSFSHFRHFESLLTIFTPQIIKLIQNWRHSQFSMRKNRLSFFQIFFDFINKGESAISFFFIFC